MTRPIDADCRVGGIRGAEASFTDLIDDGCETAT